MEPAIWDRRLKRQLERNLAAGLFGESETTLERVSLEGSYPDTEVVIFVRDSRRPGRLFGFRWGNVKPYVEGTGPESWADDPESLTTIIESNLAETLYSRTSRGLDKERCDAAGITWVP